MTWMVAALSTRHLDDKDAGVEPSLSGWLCAQEYETRERG